jgi:hypothetical protein
VEPRRPRGHPRRPATEASEADGSVLSSVTDKLGCLRLRVGFVQARDLLFEVNDKRRSWVAGLVPWPPPNHPTTATHHEHHADWAYEDEEEKEQGLNGHNSLLRAAAMN